MSRRATEGFTLLEIVVVLAVFGFLLVGLSQTVRFGLIAWRQENRTAESKADLEAVDRSLRSIVENLAPGDDSGRPPIDGSPGALVGVSRLRVPGAGLAPIPVEAGVAVSGTRLVLRWRPYHHAALLRAAPPAAETELLSGVASMRIEYWRPTGTWVSQWHEPDLPLLVRFQLRLTGDSSRRWPDIVAAPRLSRP